MIWAPFLLWASSVRRPVVRLQRWAAATAATGAAPQSSSVEPLASVLLPAPIKDRSHHRQHAQPQDGDQQGEEELDSAHASILDLHWSRQNMHTVTLP